MNFIVALIGWIIVAMDLLGIARPHLMLTAVLGWPPDLRLYITVGSRIVVGLLLLLAGPSCRPPRFTSAIGIIALVAGIVYAFTGAGRLGTIVQWISARPAAVIQLLYALAMVLGAFLIYSDSKSAKRNTLISQ